VNEMAQIGRDGTSQAARLLKALDPGYVLIDERTIKDLLAFTRKYVKELRYFDLTNQPFGDWGEFLDPLDPSDAEIAAFLIDPAKVTPESRRELFPPHLVLFLTYLKLFQAAQAELNAIGSRHLDFYFTKVLKMAKRPATQDQVNLLLDLAAGVDAIEVPKGSQVSAGPDSLGHELIYATDRRIVVNRAQIAKLSSLYVDRRIVGFPEEREAHKNRSTQVMEMLKLALGDPDPGDPLPLYPNGKEVNDALLTEVLTALRKTEKARALPQRPGAKPRWPEPVEQAKSYFFVSPEELQRVLEVVQKVDSNPTTSEWDEVDQILAKAHREKVYSGRRKVLEGIREKSGFDAMVAQALGEDPGQSNASTQLERLKPYVLRDPDFAVLKAASSDADWWDWPATYAIVEAAQRNRERMPEPVAQRLEWLNIYTAEDAAKRVVFGSEGSTGPSRWRTFGARPVEATPDTLLGWAISSPLLAMSEGDRTITLTLGFSLKSFDKEELTAFRKRLSAFFSINPDPIRFDISTAQGWKEVKPPVPQFGQYQDIEGAVVPDLMGIQWELVFDATVDAFAPPPAGQVGAGSSSPVLRLTLRQVWDKVIKKHTMPYPPLADLLLVTAFVKVSVTGLKTLSIANDEMTLDPQKPFLPFGSSPTAGARLYVGHPEIVNKKLDNLTFNLEWLGAPKEDFPTYYENYFPETDPKSPEFTAKVSLADQRVNHELIEKAKLFDVSPTKPASIKIIPPPKVIPPAGLPVGYDRLLNASSDGELLAWDRYFVWELNAPDFQHQSYPAVAAGKAIELSVAMKKEGTAASADTYKVKPPYTPKLKTLTVDYTASLEVRAEKSGAASIDQMFHIHPFGYSDMAAGLKPQGPKATDAAPAGFPFLPRYENEGELYIGLKNVAAPQKVAILFQAAEGSANPDLATPAVQWSVLDGDRWVDLDKRHMPLDTTRGLINSGILEFLLPAAATSRLLPGGLYWIRAAVAANSTAVCDTIAFDTQAVTATLVNSDAAPDHYGTPLPALSIKKFAAPVTGIAGVRQPYTSAGGRIAEQDALFYTRVSERLRHKQRALTAWDYEHLVLGQFPEIYKAKCIPAGDDSGTVRVVVIPDVRNKRPFDPFEPKAPADLLARIREFLADKVPALATVRVENPCYASVKLRLAVRFSVAGDENYYKQALNAELNRFLSPWAYEDGAEIVIGGRIYANSIVDFVDRRPYVSFVANVRLFWEDGPEVLSPAPGDLEGYFVEAEQPDEVLVAAREHLFDLISDTGYSVERFTGIGYMQIGTDFFVEPRSRKTSSKQKGAS
jgi:Baseplate J-like protein